MERMAPCDWILPNRKGENGQKRERKDEIAQEII
jgi:hypothetical protein